jgi:hypothetical protein
MEILSNLQLLTIRASIIRLYVNSETTEKDWKPMKVLEMICGMICGISAIIYQTFTVIK